MLPSGNVGAGACLGQALTPTSTRKKLKRETVPQFAVRGGRERQGTGEFEVRIAGAVSEGDGAREGKTRLPTPPLRKEENEKLMEKTRQEVMVIADEDVAGGARESVPGRDEGRSESPECLEDLTASERGEQQRCHDGEARGQGGGERRGRDAQISRCPRLPLPPQAASGSEGKAPTWSSLLASFNARPDALPPARDGAVTTTSDDASTAGQSGKGASLASGSPKEHSQVHSKEYQQEHHKVLSSSYSSGPGLLATCEGVRLAENHGEHPGQRPAAVWNGEKDSLVLETSGESGKERGASCEEVAIKTGVVKEHQDSSAGIQNFKLFNNFIIH